MLNNIQKAIILGVGILTGGFFQSASADYSVDILSAGDDVGGNSASIPQDIVVTLKSNPMANIEEACLAVTFARMLSGQPGHNVTLFVTLDGVSLADRQDRALHLMCAVPPAMDTDGVVDGALSLRDNLMSFLGSGIDNYNNLVVCPICWGARYDEGPDFGVLPGKTAPANAIGTMMGNAEKILDF